MNRIAGRARSLILLTALLLGGLAFFVGEFFAKAQQWIVFPRSPHVYTAGNIGCGVVVDREGYLLLDLNDKREYSKDLALRMSTVHWVGDRYGSIYAPALSHYAEEISGFDILNGVYSYGQYGAVQSLTLSAKVQKAALEALGQKKGTVAVYNYKTGQLLCSVTTPTYDPDNVPDWKNDTTGAYEGMFLNRFTQVTYTPGSIFKIVTAAAVLEKNPAILEETFTCQSVYNMGVDTITCETSHGRQDLKEAFFNSCNCAFAQISQLLGGEDLGTYVQESGVTESVYFDGIHTAQGQYQVDASAVNVAWSAVGQFTDLINPCAFLTYVGAVANGGQGVKPYLVEEIRQGNSVTYQAKTVTADWVMSEQTAQTLQGYMRNNVANKYGDGNFPGLTVCAKTGTAEVAGSRPNAMLAGFVTDEAYPLAFVICVQDAGYGRSVCIPIASQVLAACKELLDQ